MAPTYELKGLRKVFDDGSVAVDGISLTIEPGEHVAFIGPSGAGKTTLFRILNLTLRPTAGVVRLGGVDVSGLGESELQKARRRIGTIYQQGNRVGRLRVVHNVLAGNLGRWSTTKAFVSLISPQGVDTARRALGRVGISEKLYARTDELSGGQQQRVAIARVLVQDPDIILADEPVSSVDPSLAASIVTLLRDLSAESRKTLLLNLHSVDLALASFPRIVGIQEGRILFDLSPEKVTPEMLRVLYAGDDEAIDIERLNEILSVSGLCRPIRK
ncbi:MAG: phosphonate ABC transporter ATP-binding protein [Candidatus Rokubacteria bacterium]|nr:phosphonate ABC transporter ATP-binding protein [Candidatus Rokubacteria bacterium]